VHFGTAFHSNNTCETSYGIDVRSTPGHFPTIGLYAKLQLNYPPPQLQLIMLYSLILLGFGAVSVVVLGVGNGGWISVAVWWGGGVEVCGIGGDGRGWWGPWVAGGGFGGGVGRWGWCVGSGAVGWLPPGPPPTHPKPKQKT
jgi:hypothetical protein